MPDTPQAPPVPIGQSLPDESLRQQLTDAAIPPVVGAGLGGIYGATRAHKGKSSLRGAITGAGAGLGGGTAVSLGNAFLHSPTGKLMLKEQGLLTLAGLLGTGALGVHSGLNAGRWLSDRMGLDPVDRTPSSRDDLREMDIMENKKLWPTPLKQLFKHSSLFDFLGREASKN